MCWWAFSAFIEISLNMQKLTNTLKLIHRNGQNKKWYFISGCGRVSNTTWIIFIFFYLMCAKKVAAWRILAWVAYIFKSYCKKKLFLESTIDKVNFCICKKIRESGLYIVAAFVWGKKSLSGRI
jgi:hypothetical protein